MQLRIFAFVGADFHGATNSLFFFGLSVSCCSPYSLPPRRSISSAKCQLQSGRPPIDTDDSDISASSASSSELSANWSVVELSKSSALSFPGIYYVGL